MYDMDNDELCVMETAEDSREDSFSFEIVEHIGVLHTNANGWSKELNIVKWNGRAPKYDIREWAPDHTRMTRGITLIKEDLECIARWMAERLKTDQAPAGSAWPQPQPAGTAVSEDVPF